MVLEVQVPFLGYKERARHILKRVSVACGGHEVGQKTDYQATSDYPDF